MDSTETRANQTTSGRTILWNNLVALLLGAALMVLLHELVHFVTGIAIGYRSTIYSYGVTHDGNPTRGAIALMAISAPIFSLVVGFAMALWQPLRRVGGFAQLLWLWLAFASAQEGVTYFVIAPFGAGDTATFVREMGWPGWTTIVLCFAGVGGMFGTARLFATSVKRHAGENINTMRCMAWYPWLLSLPFAIGTGLLYTAVAKMALTPGEYFFTMLAGLSTTVFAPMSLIWAARLRVDPEPLVLKPIPILGIVGYIAMIVINLSLSWGLTLG